MSDHAAGIPGDSAPLPLYAHVADVASDPLPLLFLVMCRWWLAVVVVALIVRAMNNYVVYGDCMHLDGGPLSHAHCA